VDTFLRVDENIFKEMVVDMSVKLFTWSNTNIKMTQLVCFGVLTGKVILISDFRHKCSGHENIFKEMDTYARA
jgi:hypothetical protein